MMFTSLPSPMPELNTKNINTIVLRLALFLQGRSFHPFHERDESSVQVHSEFGRRIKARTSAD